jgi:hypothetical protein
MQPKHFLPSSYGGGPGSIPGQIMWDLLLEKWHWGGLSWNILLSLAYSHSTNYSIIINHLMINFIYARH